jgi:hypothetical protein
MREMKIKKEYIISAVIIIASILYLLLRSDTKIHYEVPSLPSLEKEAVTGVALQGPEGSVELEKNNGIWTIQPKGYRASESQVQQLISEAAGLSIRDLISPREDYDRYDLKDQASVKVTLSTEGGTAREFFIGKSSPSGSYSYIRLPDRTGIYSAPGNLRPVFSKAEEKWRDHQVMDFSPGEAESIEITGGNNSVELTKIEGEDGETPVWSRDGKTKAEDSEEIRNQVSVLSRLNATEFLETQETGQPQATVIITTSSGVHDLMVFDKEEQGYRARSSYAEGDFLIPAYSGDQILGLISQTSE